MNKGLIDSYLSFRHKLSSDQCIIMINFRPDISVPDAMINSYAIITKTMFSRLEKLRIP